MSFPIQFVGGSYEGRSKNINSQRCVNFFPFVDREGGKVIVALHGTPGLIELNDFGSNNEVRGIHVFNNNLYCVVGKNLYPIDAGGYTLQDLGIDPPLEGQGGRIVGFDSLGVLETSTGIVKMADNGNQMMIVGGYAGYIIDKSVNQLRMVNDADFPANPTSVVFQDGYFIVTAKDSNSFWISGLYDGNSWDALDYASAEAKPDKLLCVGSYNLELWLFGEISTEIWYNSGDSDFPFARMGRGVIEIGIGAIDSLAQSNEALFWFDNNRQVRMASGYVPNIISTPQIDYQLSKYAVVNDAIGFTYTIEGYTFYQLTFPTEKKTWVYCVKTGFWHEMSSAPNYDRHRANCVAVFEKRVVVGDYKNGKLYHLDLDAYTDDGELIKRKRTASVFDPQNRKDIFFHEFEIEFEAGVGLLPQVGEKVINGDFGAWTSGLPDGWTQHGTPDDDNYVEEADGKLRVVRDEYTSGVWQNVHSEDDVGVHFILTIDIVTVVSGSITLEQGVGNYISTGISTVGTHRFRYAPVDTDGIVIGATNQTDIVVDNISIKEDRVDEGVDPQAMLKWSDDNGHTWSNEHWASIGKIGEYDKKVKWRRLGMSKNRIFSVDVAHPGKAVILGAYLDATLGK